MSSPTPTLFTIPNFITAGSGRAMLNIIERLDRSRFAPAVAVLKKGGDLDKVVEELGLSLLESPFTIPARPYLTLLPRAFRAARPFRPHRFTLWHSFHYSSDYTEPIIARMAGARAWVFTKKNMGWTDRAWKVRSTLATRIAAQNTDMLREFFAAPRLARKTRLVPRGVVTTKFQPGVEPRLRVRQAHNIPAEAVLIVCVAHLLPVKGHPTLLEGLAQVPQAHLALAGAPQDKPYLSQLEAMIGQLGVHNRVHFLGPVKDVPALLAEADIFVLPSWAKWRMEGCPVALLEAMSCGKACVATDIPGSRDLVDHGKTGLLVAPEDAEALTAALRQLVESPDVRDQLGRGARQRVLDHFTIEREVAAHEALYEEVLGLQDH